MFFLCLHFTLLNLTLGCDTVWRRKWQPTPVSLPREFHGQRSLEDCSPWGHKRVEHDWVTNMVFWLYAISPSKKKWTQAYNNSPAWWFTYPLGLEISWQRRSLTARSPSSLELGRVHQQQGGSLGSPDKPHLTTLRGSQGSHTWVWSTRGCRMDCGNVSGDEAAL